MDEQDEEPRPNVVIDAVCADHTEYAGMGMSINLRQKRIWTGFDLFAYDNAEEFLSGILHMLSYAGPNLVLKEEDGSDWTDDDLQWGQQYDELKGDE
jgi:hypothetical protein